MTEIQTDSQANRMQQQEQAIMTPIAVASRPRKSSRRTARQRRNFRVKVRETDTLLGAMHLVAFSGYDDDMSAAESQREAGEAYWEYLGEAGKDDVHMWQLEMAIGTLNAILAAKPS